MARSPGGSPSRRSSTWPARWQGRCVAGPTERNAPHGEGPWGPALGETEPATAACRRPCWAWAVVVVFMLVYYGIVAGAGGMADVAVLLNLLFILAAMAITQATFTLPGIAGVILTVRYGGRRQRADLRTCPGRNGNAAWSSARPLNAGYDKGVSPPFWTPTLTTLITCVVLGFLGSEEVEGLRHHARRRYHDQYVHLAVRDPPGVQHPDRGGLAEGLLDAADSSACRPSTGSPCGRRFWADLDLLRGGRASWSSRWSAARTAKHCTTSSSSAVPACRSTCGPGIEMDRRRSARGHYLHHGGQRLGGGVAAAVRPMRSSRRRCRPAKLARPAAGELGNAHRTGDGGPYLDGARAGARTQRRAPRKDARSPSTSSPVSSIRPA